MTPESRAPVGTQLYQRLLSCVAERGRAETRDGDEGSGEDPRGLQPARAIRRALANGSLKAAQVDAAWACFDVGAFPAAADRAEAAVALALGPYAQQVSVRIEPIRGDGHGSLRLAALRCATAVARGQARVGVVVGIGIAGRNTAQAFSKLR